MYQNHVPFQSTTITTSPEIKQCTQVCTMCMYLHVRELSLRTRYIFNVHLCQCFYRTNRYFYIVSSLISTVKTFQLYNIRYQFKESCKLIQTKQAASSNQQKNFPKWLALSPGATRPILPLEYTIILEKLSLARQNCPPLPIKI